MVCHNCQLQTKKSVKTAKAINATAVTVAKTFQEIQDRPHGTMRLPIEKALQALQLLVEGVSIVGVLQA